MMSSLLLFSSCPRCMESCLPAGTVSLPLTGSQWFNEFMCGNCGQQPWFECCYTGCNIPAHKNLFYTSKQLRNHAQHWHIRPIHLADSISTDRTNDTHAFTDNIGIIEPNETQVFNNHSVVDVSRCFCFANKGPAQFAEWSLTVWSNSPCFRHPLVCIWIKQLNCRRMLSNYSYISLKCL